MRASRAPLKVTPATHPRSSSSTAVIAAGPSRQHPQQVPTLPLVPPGPSPGFPTGHDAPASVAVALPSPGGPPSLAPPLHPETGALGASRQQAPAPGQFCALSSLGPPAGSQSAEEQLEQQQEQEVQVEADTQEKGAANPRGE